LIPRIIPHSEWDHIERGLSQRVVALNLFLQDVYGKQRIFSDRKISRSLVYYCPNFRREVIGIEVPRGIYTHICGIDLVRDSKTGEFCVLEDNVKCLFFTPCFRDRFASVWRRFSPDCAPSAAPSAVPTPTKPNGLSGRVVERLSYDKVGEIFKQGLHSFLGDLLRMCGTIGDDIARNYFYYAVVA
jgi:hypothetical protein